MVSGSCPSPAARPGALTSVRTFRLFCPRFYVFIPFVACSGEAELAQRGAASTLPLHTRFSLSWKPSRQLLRGPRSCGPGSRPGGPGFPAVTPLPRLVHDASPEESIRSAGSGVPPGNRRREARSCPTRVPGGRARPHKPPPAPLRLEPLAVCM